jgi:hypothetical protein
MERDINSSKTVARPSHEALEEHASATQAGKSKQQRIDQAAMEAARRSTHRIQADEDNLPGSSIISK